MAQSAHDSSLLRAPVAILLAWLVPGLGHLFLGHKVRGTVFLVAITLTFWTGVAIGGVKSVLPERAVPSPSSANDETPSTRSWWFFAQVMNGGYTLGACSAAMWCPQASYLSWPSGDVASVYSGVAGLLNLLIMIDALARAEGLALLTRSTAPSRRSTGPPRRGGGRRD